MLLTSGQISMGISSIIVFTFSTLLFLSGYILQQRTVRDLQEIFTAASQLPPPPVQDTATSAMDMYPWDKAAYVQVVTQHSEICGAGMTFAELVRQGSKAKMVLVYPRSWDDGTRPETKGKDRSLRLLRRVIVRYGIGLRGVDVDEGDRREVQSLFEIGDLEKVMLLRGSGVVYNASALDGLFLEDGGRHFVGVDGDVIAAVVEPADVYRRLQGVDLSGLRLEGILEGMRSEGVHEGHLFGETRVLKDALKSLELIGDDDGLQAAYMRISDPGIRGPEYDIPQGLWEQARPESTRERRVWERTYADYRAQRMGVCGLEVEPLPKAPMLEEGTAY